MPPSPERILCTGLSIAPLETWLGCMLDAGAEVWHVGFSPAKLHGRPGHHRARYRFVPHAGLAHAEQNGLMNDPAVAAEALPVEAAHLRQLAAEFRPRIVHSFGIDYGALACAEAGIGPRVVSAWGYLNDLLFKLPPRLSERARKVLAPAAAVLVDGPNLVAPCQAVLPSQVWTVFLGKGIDTQLFQPATPIARQQTRRALRLPDSGTIVLSARGWDPIYNHLLILEAFQRALPQLPSPAHLLFLAMNRSQSRTKAAKHLDQVKARVTELALEEHVRFLPEIPPLMMPAILNCATLVVSYPQQDMFPFTILEALACECPVVAGRLPDLAGTECETYCELVAPANVDALADGIVRVVVHPPPPAQRTAARQAVVADHDSRLYIERLLELYARLEEHAQGTNRS